MISDDLRQSKRKASCVYSINQTNRHTYQLLVNRPNTRLSTLQSQNCSENIFKQNSPLFMGEDRESRPIGGVELMKRMDLKYQSKQRRLSKGKIKLIQNREPTVESKHRQKRAQTQLILARVDRCKRSKAVVKTDPHEQTLKEHRSYTIQPKKHSKSSQSQSILSTGRWKATQKQRKNYLDKTALAGQMSHSSMVAHLGERHFEYSLRNRWQDEIQPAQYVYQIQEGQKFTDNWVINRMKKYRPDIKERQRLLLLGRPLTKKD